MRLAVRSRLIHVIVTLTLGAAPFGASHAIQFDLDFGDGVQGTLNTVLTAGAGIRVQGRAPDLVGKSNLDPNVCGGQFQNCQGLFLDQYYPAQKLAAAPGQATHNADDGNLNYDKGDLTQAVFKATQDLSLKYGDFGLFAKWLYFYDFVNNDFTEFHPNRITKVRADICRADPDSPDCTIGNQGGSNAVFYQQYGPGEVVRNKRTDGEVLRQIGTDLQLFDMYVYGQLPIPFTEDKNFSFKLGRQTVNWGESTVLVINSVNQVNPVNANNLFRVGFDLSELFTPTNMLFASFEPFENTTVEAIYGLEWRPLEIPAPGSYFSFVDIGTNNAVNNVGINFGGPAEDPDTCGTVYNPDSGCNVPLDNPLSGLTNTSTTIRRLKDKEPGNFSQFGLSVKYFAEWLGNGTELGFYFLNYASNLPYLSVYATNPSCARAEHPDNVLGRDAQNGVELLIACPDLPLTHPTTQLTPNGLPILGGPENATSNAVPIDTVKFQLEYPENIQMYGVSFNTTAGDLSLQGEVAFRPNLPLQVDVEDLVFTALQPMLARCRRDAPCLGSNSGVGTDADGNEITYGPSNYEPYPGQPAGYSDTFDLIIGAGVDSARSFPSFVNQYRGIAAGETVPNSYIQGYERFAVWQGNLGATYVQGATDNWLGADQVIWLFEVGAQYVPNLPSTDKLQIDAPGTFYHASAGADGTMTSQYAQDCAGTEDCHFGPDGLRFNPSQERASGYADDMSYGYAIVNLTRYESVFPGVSFAPITIWKHDVQGTSVDVANQFLEGRKNAIFLLETRYKEALSLNLGYTWFFGGGRYNLLRDRDQALAYVKYQF
ncbi:MAG: DUF1302 family protein [Pseudomonadota bacterium]